MLAIERIPGLSRPRGAARRRHRLSIRQALGGLLLGGALLIGLPIVTMLSLQVDRTFTDLRGHLADAQASMVDAHIQLHLAQHFGRLEEIAALPPVAYSLRHPQAPHPRLDAVLAIGERRFPGLQTWLLDAQGRRVAAWPAMAPDRVAPDGDRVARVLAGTEPRALALLPDTAGYRWRLLVPVHLDDGRIGGALVADVGLNVLCEGDRLAEQLLGVGVELHGPEGPILRVVKAGYWGDELLRRPGPTADTVLVFRADHSILAPMRQDFILDIGLTVALMVSLVGIVLAAAGRRLFLEPIRQLQAIALALAEGRPPARARGWRRQLRELDDLRYGLLRMAREVQSRESRLRASNAALARTNTRLAASRRELAESEKMVAIGVLTAGMAHELNTPLGVIRANLSTLEEYRRSLAAVWAARDDFLAAHPELVSEWEQRLQRSVGGESIGALLDDMTGLLDDCQTGAGRMGRLVERLRELAITERGVTGRVDVNHCLAQALQLSAPARGPAVVVEQRLGELAPLQATAESLTVLFMHLLNNAAQALPPGEGFISLRSWQTPDKLYVEVADTGRGVPPEHLERIFLPFFTTREVGEGVGLGLAIAYGIVARYGGRIDVCSEVDAGSVFTVVLPRSDAAIRDASGELCPATGADAPELD